jgi:hypothetical protein
MPDIFLVKLFESLIVFYDAHCSKLQITITYSD